MSKRQSLTSTPVAADAERRIFLGAAAMRLVRAAKDDFSENCPRTVTLGHWASTDEFI